MEDTLEAPKPSMSFTTTGGPCVETIPVDLAGLIQLANQLALDSAAAQVTILQCFNVL